MTKHDHLRALARVCRDFGGRLSLVSQGRFDQLFERSRGLGGFYESPLTSAHGLHWQKKIIYAVREREEIGSIIHEMGHVFADCLCPDHAKCREFNWFGWEVATARAIGAYDTWSEQNGNYTTDECGGNEWGALTESARKAVVADRIKYAKKIGVVASDGTPRSIR